MSAFLSNPRPGRTSLPIFFLVCLFSLLPPSAVVFAKGGDLSGNNGPQRARAACLRCHGMRTMGYLDERTGGFINLFVDGKLFTDSNHGRLGCRDCHGAALDVVPHYPEAARERLGCLDCHRNGKNDENRFPRALFERIEREFERSIHFQALPNHFNCFSCHDAHAFQRAARVEDLSKVVREGNAICLKCHGKPGVASDRSQRLFSSLEETHRWLPKTKRHWQAVRCVECHTPHFGERTHTILGKMRAERNCVACHSRDSVLRAKLYRYRAPQSREKGGLFSGTMHNEAYVIGMSRQPWLDWLSFIGLGLTLLGVGGHGLARWLTARRKHHETID